MWWCLRLTALGRFEYSARPAPTAIVRGLTCQGGGITQHFDVQCRRAEQHVIINYLKITVLHMAGNHDQNRKPVILRVVWNNTDDLIDQLQPRWRNW